MAEFTGLRIYWVHLQASPLQLHELIIVVKVEVGS